MKYKHDYPKALERLLAIIQALHAGETLSVTELAERFGVSSKTIQRDLNERLIGLPIEKVGRRWRMRPEAMAGSPALTSEDRMLLEQLEVIGRMMGGSFAARAKEVFAKIKGRYTSPIYAKLDLESIDSHEAMMAELEQLILDRQEAKIVYAPRGEAKEILTRPLKLLLWEGFWYLLIEDASDGVIKKLHLKSIRACLPTGVRFSADRFSEQQIARAVSIWFDPAAKPVEVRLWMRASAARYFLRKPLATQRLIRQHEEESIEVAITITHEREILPVIKRWAPLIAVIEPSSLAQKVRSDFEAWLSEHA
jgi:predicted DNA-binding transcriptional regulator YafY